MILVRALLHSCARVFHVEGLSSLNNATKMVARSPTTSPHFGEVDTAAIAERDALIVEFYAALCCVCARVAAQAG